LSHLYECKSIASSSHSQTRGTVPFIWKNQTEGTVPPVWLQILPQF
jgi:hypothetical protein